MSGKPGCKFCDKTGLRMLPLVYGVLSSESIDDLASLPGLPGKLGAGVTDLALDSQSKYVVRMARQGYLYVLIERAGVKYWQGYMVLNDAFLYGFDVDAPPQKAPEFSCDRTACGIDASMIDIPDAKNVSNAWLLFTPSAMTSAKLAEYKNKAEAFAAQGKLQHFSPAGWLGGCTAQPHTLLAAEIPKTVADYVLYAQNAGRCAQPSATALGRVFGTQVFPVCSDAYTGAPEEGIDGSTADRLAALYNKMKHDGYGAIALYDHIGITQALNNFRNDALTPIEDFLAKTTSDKISNQRRLEVSQAIEDVKAGFIQFGVSIAKKQIELIESRPLPDFDENNARMLRGLGRIQEAEKLEERVRQNHEAREANRKRMLSGERAEQEWNRKYQSLLAYKEEIEPFQASLKQISEAASKEADTRAPAHLRWVTSDRLVDAFDVYDPESTSSGFCFTQEHMHCTFGMFGPKDNGPVLAKWVDIDKIERKNLYMRANYFNQQTLQDQASAAFTEIRQHVKTAGHVSAVASAPWTKFSKGLIDSAKKIDSAWDEWLRDRTVKDIQLGKLAAKAGNPIHNLSNFHRSSEGLMYARIAEWTQALSTKAGKLDQGISAVVGMMVYPKLGKLAEEIAFTELTLQISPEKIAQKKAEKIAEIKEQHRTKQRVQEVNRRVNADAEKNRAEAAALAKKEAEAVEGSIDELIRDEQKKVRDKVKIALDDMDKGARRETNNFRHARMGCLLMAIESYSLITKTIGSDGSARKRWEIAGSVLSLTSMSFDMVYAVVKSLREIEPYKSMKGFEKAANLMRGGLKMGAGTLSAMSGVISVVMEGISAWGEWDKKNGDRILFAVYSGRAGTGFLGMGYGLAIAFTYSAPVLERVAASGLLKGTAIAARLAGYAKRAYDLEKFRTLWMIRAARINLIGLAITGVEIGYRCFIMDDDLENWCQACTFRKDKSTGWFSEKPFNDTKSELEALEKAFQAIKE